MKISVKTEELNQVLVDYSSRVSEYVVGEGYQHIQEGINDQNFPCSNSGVQKMDMLLVSFDKVVSVPEMNEEIRKQNWRHANIQELISIRRQLLNKPQSFFVPEHGVIRAHGSKCKGESFVAGGGIEIIQVVPEISISYPFLSIKLTWDSCHLDYKVRILVVLM